jgi:hypothetical protein
VTTRGYLDIGAVQRKEGGSGTSHVGYLDIGAVQREEASGNTGTVAATDGRDT